MSEIPDVDLVFVSGVASAEVWKHQERYFERTNNVETFGGLNYEDLRSEVEGFLDESENAVVIGSEFGNRIVQGVEDHESVASTVLTGPHDSIPGLERRKLRWAMKAIKKPKIMQKTFFDGDYRVARDFLEDARPFSPEVFDSFRGKGIGVPVKSSLVVYGKNCRFSTREKVEELGSNADVAYIDSGSFPFYEKPQEFNKALRDFLVGMSDLLEKRELVKAANRNRSLKDYQELKVKR